MTTTTPSAALQKAIDRHRAGDRSEAERLYRAALADDPNNDTAAFLTGVLALESSRLETALEMFTLAATVAPNNAAYHANLGETERRLQRLGPAAASLLTSVSLDPALAAPHYNLGLVLQEMGDGDGAVACFERAAELQPSLPNVGQRIAAARSARRAGVSTAAALVEVATALARQGRRAGGIAIARRALEIDPRLLAGHCNLGNMLFEEEQIEEAIGCYRRAIEIAPRDAGVRANLASALSRCGRLDEALPLFEQAVALNPGNALNHSSYVFQLHFSPHQSARDILREARRWDVSHGRPLASTHQPHANGRDPDRRLRVGYVSPDFRGHCQAMFTTPLLAHHDHERFEIFCYADVPNPDGFTASLRGHADHWRSVAGLDDAAVAARIRDDGIDVLVDLTMHMAESRLRVFARKPAPVQITWLAYPGTTGLSAIDYRLTDPFLDPPGSDTSVYVEESLRLPDAFWCYAPLVPPETADQTPSALPARSAARLRFGCLNNFCKVNGPVIALWARLLGAVEGSTLALLVPGGDSRARTLAAFDKHGIGAKRIEFVTKRPRPEYLAMYRGIDVCLDTFPYNGHTTSLDAFWMGVPVVTLVGPTVVGRAGLCQAMNLGLPDLIAKTEDEYVQIAIGLAQDRSRLSEFHATLRRRMESSPLMDSPRFARSMEHAFRTAWERWCKHAE